MSTMIQLSPSATEEILRLRSQQASSDLKLHLGVQHTGCLGFSYHLNFGPSGQSEDTLYQVGPIEIIVSSEDLKYVDGMFLDYSEDLMGGAFRFHNPNASQTCSCGNSFTCG